jgi:hypothetical protein
VRVTVVLALIEVVQRARGPNRKAIRNTIMLEYRINYKI